MSVVVENIGVAIVDAQLVDIDDQIDMLRLDRMKMIFTRCFGYRIRKSLVTDHRSQFHRAVVIPIFSVEKEQYDILVASGGD